MQLLYNKTVQLDFNSKTSTFYTLEVQPKKFTLEVQPKKFRMFFISDKMFLVLIFEEEDTIILKTFLTKALFAIEKALARKRQLFWMDSPHKIIAG